MNQRFFIILTVVVLAVCLLSGDASHLRNNHHPLKAGGIW